MDILVCSDNSGPYNKCLMDIAFSRLSKSISHCTTEPKHHQKSCKYKCNGFEGVMWEVLAKQSSNRRCYWIPQSLVMTLHNKIILSYYVGLLQVTTCIEPMHLLVHKIMMWVMMSKVIIMRVTRGRWLCQLSLKFRPFCISKIMALSVKYAVNLVISILAFDTA